MCATKPPTRRAAASPIAPPGRDDHLAALEQAGDRITQFTAEGGNAIAVLHNGDDAYPKMIAAIEAAKASVGLSSYIFRADVAGGAFIDALIRACRRGVQVRVLIDGIGGGYFRSPAYKRLRRHGVPAFRFMHSPLPWRMPFINLRTHRKLLVVDGRIAFTGGLNIGGENVLMDQPRHPVRDTHFCLEGPVVAQLVEAFAESWLYAAGENLGGEAWFPPLDEVGEAVGRVVLSGPDKDVEKIEFIILEAVACARQSIRVTTPYFLPEDRLVTALALAAMRGVEVDVIVPSRGNHPVVDWAMRAQIVAAGRRRLSNLAEPATFQSLENDDHRRHLVSDRQRELGCAQLSVELRTQHGSLSRRHRSAARRADDDKTGSTGHGGRARSLAASRQTDGQRRKADAPLSLRDRIYALLAIERGAGAALELAVARKPD